MKKLHKVLFVVLAITLVVALFPTIALADKGGEPNAKASDKAKGNDSTPEADYGSGTGDDSTINKGPKSSDRVNNDDENSNGPNRPTPPSEAAGRNGNCDNNGWDCGPQGPPDDNPPYNPPVVEPPTVEPPTTEITTTTITVELPETARVCFYSEGNAVEVSDDLAAFERGSLEFESTVFAENWDVTCFDVSPNESYVVLGWNAQDGHDGPLYQLDIGPDAEGLIEFHNPIEDTVTIQWLTVTPLNLR